MQIAILDGGMAVRLGEETKDKPKSMLNINGKPFLEYQLEFLRKGGVKNIVLCVGHLWQQIESYFGNGQKFGVNITYSIEDSPLGTAGALKKAAPLLENTFFTMYGDSYLSLNFKKVMSYFETQEKQALMTVYKNQNQYDKSNTAIEDGLVKKYSKEHQGRDMVYIEYGANIFRKEALELVPENRFYPLEEVLPDLIEMNELLAYEVEKRFYEIGSTNGLREFRECMEAVK